jgi:hypothetical protein
MKLYFLDGNEEWCSLARILGWNAETVVNGTLLEDSKDSVVFVPEYMPVSHIRMLVKNAHIVVVWRQYKLGVIENTEHSLNVVTEKNLLDKVSNSAYVPENVHDAFSIMRTISEKRTRVIESDAELENVSVFERARIFKDTIVYKGKRFIREAYIAGCDVSADIIPAVASRDSVAKHLNEYLNKLLIFLDLSNSSGW